MMAERKTKVPFPAQLFVKDVSGRPTSNRASVQGLHFI